MSEIKVGMVVEHKASREDGAVVEIDEESGMATVSWNSSKTTNVPLAALQPIEEDDGDAGLIPQF